MTDKKEEVDVQKPLLGSSDPNNGTFSYQGKLEKIISFINNLTHRVSMIILFLLMFLTTGDVVGRYFFNKPITGTYELTGLGLLILIFFSLGVAQLKKDHIQIDFLVKKFSPRIQEVLNAISSLVLLILILLGSWQLFKYAQRLLASNETSGDLGIPLYGFAIVAAIGFLLFSLTYLLEFVKSLSKAVKRG